jgi:uncharacterized coiled-coil DUF342 family protein
MMIVTQDSEMFEESLGMTEPMFKNNRPGSFPKGLDSSMEKLSVIKDKTQELNKNSLSFDDTLDPKSLKNMLVELEMKQTPTNEDLEEEKKIIDSMHALSSFIEVRESLNS